MHCLADSSALGESRAARLGDRRACMAGNMQRQWIDAREWATLPEVGNGAEETQRQFANWYQSENPRWTKAARRYLEDFPYLVEDAVQEGWIKGDRQLLKSESAVTRLWSGAQSGDHKALDQLRGYMFRVVRRAAHELLKKEIGDPDPKPGPEGTTIGSETLTRDGYRSGDSERSRPLTGSGSIGSDNEGLGGRRRTVRLDSILRHRPEVEPNELEEAGFGDPDIGIATDDPFDEPGDGVQETELAAPHLTTELSDSADLEELDLALPEIAHWDDDEATMRALLVVHGIGAGFEPPTPAFLGSFNNGEEFLAGFRVWLRRTKHRNKLEWVQVVNALAAGLSPAEVKGLVGGERGTQAWWGRVRGTLHSNFDRWRQHWLELDEDGL
jgi:hypothetical protein